MSKTTVEFGSKFSRYLDRLLKIQKRFEALHLSKTITVTEIEFIYQSLFINAISSFESYIEQLFIGLLCGQYTSFSKVRPNMVTKREVDARKIILSGRTYVDWLPYKNKTIVRAKAYFKRGLPFTVLDENDQTLIQEALTLRNAIAHKSSASRNKFKKLIDNMPLIPAEKRSVASFLRSPYTSKPLERRFEYYINNLGVLFIRLCRCKSK